MAMLGYVLRDHPVYAHLGVEFGEVYRGSPIVGQRYDYAILYRDEDLAAAGVTGTKLVWQDSVAQMYQYPSP